MSNHLVGQTSPYLLQHVENPVDWYPWGEEAFARARAENKPIFLSIGYSTCHWCHVMAHESFENPGVAAILNRDFISIKVDREERPDVDHVYMSFVQATTGHGGWPMSVWLTPDLKPFTGGTYFPPEDLYGRMGFATLLRGIAQAWRDRREQILAQGDKVIDILYEHAATKHRGEGGAGPEIIEEAYRQIAGNFDGQQGGFGGAPKFPRPVTLNFLLRYYARRKAEKDGLDEARRALDMTLLTLRKMADGGMHDHVGGGFHRYAVDEFWHVPHFEKMLYDQGQLAVAYAEAYQITRQPFYAEIVRDIADYVLRDLTHPDGGFYSAEDADSVVEHGKPAHAEGAFYVWTERNVDRVLEPGIRTIFKHYYGVESQGNAPEGSDPHGEFTGKNILIARLSLEALARQENRPTEELRVALAAARARLFAVREDRPRPHLDDKVITSWNGLMISGLAKAAQVLWNPHYAQAARAAAEFIQKHLYEESSGKLKRSYRGKAGAVDGFADDYAFLIQGLLDLYETTWEIRWLQWADRLQVKQDEFFLDPREGGYFSTGTGDPSILLRMKEDYDGAEPSPNSVAALNLLRLAAMLQQPEREAQAQKILDGFAGTLRQSPITVPQLTVALDYSLKKPMQIVIAGKAEWVSTQALVKTVREQFVPRSIVVLADGAEGQAWLAQKNPLFRSFAAEGGQARAYVCRDFTCQQPVTAAEELKQQLA